MRQVIQFPQNEPVEIALAFTQGKTTPSQYPGCADRVMFSLAWPENAVTFLELGVAQKINLLGPAVGERLVICKRNAKRWDVWLSQDAEAARAAREAGVPLKTNGRPAWGGNPPATWEDIGSVAEVKARASVGTPAPALQSQHAEKTPVNNGNHSKLEEALKTAVAAAHAAGEYAKSIGYTAMPQFTSEDLRTMANTIIIQNGGGR
jgi:hypothetical protein